MGTFPSLNRSERAPHKITTAAVRAQDQFLSTVDAVTSPDSPAIGRPRFNFTSLNRPHEFYQWPAPRGIARAAVCWSWGVLSAPRGRAGAGLMDSPKARRFSPAGNFSLHDV